MAGTTDPLDSMAPWDAAPYFQTPVEVTGNLGGATPVLLVAADPNRVALLISCAGAGGSTVTTNPRGVSTQGLTVGGNTAPIQLLFSEVGPLVQMAWYAVSSFPTQFTAISVSLNKWPDKGKANARPKQADATQPANRAGNRGVNPVNRTQRKP